MIIEAAVGAGLGTAVTQLYEAVKGAKKKVTNFQPALTRLKSMLESLIPHVNEISRLNHELKVPEGEMKELTTILQNGLTLVCRCSEISRLDFIRIMRCYEELLELDNSLLRYFGLVVPLQQLIDIKEMLLMIRKLHLELVAAKYELYSSKPGKCKNYINNHINIESSEELVDGKYRQYSRKAKEYENYIKIKSSQEPDEGKSSKTKFDEYYSERKSSQEFDEGEPSNPKGDDYFGIQSCQDPKKKERSGKKSPLKMFVFRAGAEDEEESSKSKEDDSSQEPDEEESSNHEGDEYFGKNYFLERVEKVEYQTIPSSFLSNHQRSELETWMFRLKGCIYIFGPEEYSINYDEKILYQEMGTSYVANCQCKKRHGYVMVSRVDKVGIGKSEFEQQMKTFGKIENHPNIVSLFGYCFHQSELFLFYDTFPKGAAKGASLYTRLHGDSWRVVNSDYPPIRSAPCEFSLKSKLKIAHGVAMGISHLHSVECIHGNLHSYNVIINSDLDGCISDYGLLNFSCAAKQSDVNSFGVILLEMLSGTVPPDFEDHHWWVEKVVSVQDEKYPKIKTLFGINRQKRKMLKIAKLCVERNLDKRPEMDDVVKKIQKIQSSLRKIA